MFGAALHFIPLAFAALLPVVNPPGSALILLGIVGNKPPATYRRLAKRIAFGMLAFIVTVELVGAWLLKFFGISLPVLQVAGGVTLAAMGWRMLNAHEAPPSDAQGAETDADSILEQAFYPLTFPLTVGPGVIVVVLTLSASAAGHGWLATVQAHVAIFAAAVLLAVMVYLSYAYAPRLSQMISRHAVNGVQRLISFILLCIGVQIAWGGLSVLLRSIRTAAVG